MRPPEHAELAGHAGCAQAIAGLLRLLPIHRARGQCYLPRDMLSAAGTTPEEFPGRSAGAVVAARRCRPWWRWRASIWAPSSTRPAALPASLRPAFLPLALTAAYLDRVERGKDGMSSLRKHYLMLKTASRGW